MLLEIWLKNDEYMDTFFALLTFITTLGSLVFVWVGFNFGKDYLSQYRKKIKEERKIQLIIEIKKGFLFSSKIGN